jgi:hypothetical protein
MPDAEDARLMLARVGVATWSDCEEEEEAFLEAHRANSVAPASPLLPADHATAPYLPPRSCPGPIP